MPSIDEAVLIAGKNEPEEIADAFISKGVKNVIIKLGSNGSFLRREGNAKGEIYPPFFVNAVDTTGAGDSFCSGFLAAFASDMPLNECMVFANAVGAHCVTKKGATTGIKSFKETLEFIDSKKGD